METVVGSFYTASSCLYALRNLGLIQWEAINPKQEKFLGIYENCKDEIKDIKELEREVSIGTVVPVNAFLTRKGFDIQLDEIGPQDIAVASVLDLLLKWLNKGKVTVIPRRKEYSAVELIRDVNIYTIDGFNNPVASVTTKTDDKVCMTVLKSQPKDAFETFEIACKLLRNNKKDIAYYKGVVFPMVDLDVKPDISWIVGLHEKYPYSIGVALQQTKLRMNEKGVHIKEGITGSARPMSYYVPPLIIDEPFLIVISRPNLKYPFFSAFLAEDYWKEPKGELEDL